MKQAEVPSTQLNFSDPKVIETIKRTVAQGVDDIELAMFLELCKSSGLNPFKRECWCIKAGNRAQIMVGLNGYLKIANSHPQFDGMEIELVEDKNQLVKAICKVHRKDRKYPSTGIALMSEYKKSTPIWQQMPSVMLGKVAKCIAIREAFPLETAGTYAEEEMPSEYSATKADVRPAVEVAPSLKFFVYDLSQVDDKKRHAAISWALDNGAKKDVDTGMYVSPKRLARLDKYEANYTADMLLSEETQEEMNL